MRRRACLASVLLALSLTPGCFCAWVVDQRGDLHFAQYEDPEVEDTWVYYWIVVDLCELVFSPLLVPAHLYDGDPWYALWAVTPFVQYLQWPDGAPKMDPDPNASEVGPELRPPGGGGGGGGGNWQSDAAHDSFMRGIEQERTRDAQWHREHNRR